MKLTEIDFWATPDGHHTLIKRYYTNPAVEHVVLLYPDKVITCLLKGNNHHPIKPGIHHRVRPL